MTDMERIAALLAERGLPIIGTIVSNPSSSNAYFIPLRLTRRADGRKSPSGLALAAARSSLLELGYVVDFILIDEETRNIEESLRASLLGTFPDDVRNSFYSPGEGQPQAWIEFKRQADAGVKRRLEEHLRKFADVFSLPSLSLSPIGEANTATNFEILSAVRHLAPVDLPTLKQELAGRGHDVPSSDWVNRRLDALRKSDLVLRRRDGTYVLTAKALAHLGTRKGARSPDVRRVLALAWRKL
jgi:hypothetical protein